MDISRSKIQVKQGSKFYTVLLATNEKLYRSNMKEEHWINADYNLLLYKH